MRRSLNPILALALGGLLLALPLASPAPTLACSCTNNLTLQEEFDYASSVFSGRVLDIQPSVFGDWLEVFFEPLARWKGPLGYRAMVVTPNNGSICGSSFEVGEEYLVFCSTFPYGLTYTPVPFTHLCSRTSPLAGNVLVSQLPAPLLPVPAARPTWGALKIAYR